MYVPNRFGATFSANVLIKRQQMMRWN